MNSDFPPLRFVAPQFQKRRPEKPRRAPLPDELVVRRAEVARVLGVKVQDLSVALHQMSDDERRAVFYKLTHEAPIDLTGTGLKPIVERSPHVTLAVPRSDNLDPFNAKLQEFGSATPSPSGHLPHQHLAHITDIARGDPKDRLSDELFEQYDDLIKRDALLCEIELISLRGGSRQQREEIASILEELRTAFASGVHGTLFEHEEIRASCRVVIRCTGKMFQRLVEDRNWQTKISWFEPKPRFETFQSVWNNFRLEDLGAIEPPDEDAPIVCVVDSGLTSGNPFLEKVTRHDLLHSFLKQSPDDPFDGCGHGSGVASLAAYYALNLDKSSVNRAQVWIASARILNDANQLEDERLFSQILREVVATFVPLGVRIFNLSVGDIAKQWNPTSRRTTPRKSWVARTIDQLSREYDIVFVTCSGNVDTNSIEHFINNDCPYPRYFSDADACILDPGQAALALTVGSIAPTTLVLSTAATAIAAEDQPSPFTRCGPGMRGETKPELVEFGGNLTCDRQSNWVRANLGTSVVMASHQLTPAAVYDHGTSLAAPRVSHRLAILLRDLHDIGISDVSAPLLKAFLVNSAAYRGDPDSIAAIQNELRDDKHWLNVLGYGFPDHVRATYCDDHSVVLFYQGEIAGDEVAYFDLPIPAAIGGSTGTKRLTVTVAHYPEVQRWGLERYLGTDLKWRIFRGDVNRDEIIGAMSQEEEAPNGDDQEEAELPNELKFQLGITRRSRGAVQHDVFEWKQHRDTFSENHYTLAIAAYKRWRSVTPVPVGIVVRIEDLGRAAKVYTEVQAILAELQVQAKARV